jgi:hypothetical protein
MFENVLTKYQKAVVLLILVVLLAVYVVSLYKKYKALVRKLPWQTSGKMFMHYS